jgi:DNA-binding CsgD family transcriptional regulator
MLLSDFTDISGSSSKESLRVAIERLASELEFERWSLMFVKPGVTEEFEWSSLCNPPKEYMDLFYDQHYCQDDPVMQHLKTSSRPIIWGSEIYERSKTIHKWEEQARYGYGTGFGVAFHLANAQHVVVGVERQEDLNDHPKALLDKFAKFQLFAACAIEPCIRVLGELSERERECPLTKRELEVLQWTLEGKTAGEIGQLLSIAEGTAAIHANRASQKLGSVNKFQAALKAHRLGWIKS